MSIDALIEAAEKEAKKLHALAESDSTEAGYAVTAGVAREWERLATEAKAQLDTQRGAS